MPVVESRIDTVTLYQQGARVTRRLVLDCPEGKPPTEIEIPRLPLSLFDATVRVRVLSTDTHKADLAATHVRVGLWIPPARRPWRRWTKRRCARCASRGAPWRASSGSSSGRCPSSAASPSRLARSRRRASHLRPRPSGPRMALEQFSHEGVQSRLADARKLREQLRKLQEEVAVLEQKIAQASTAREVTAGELYKSVHVNCATAAPRWPGQSSPWSTSSPARAGLPATSAGSTRDCRQVELVMRALICQDSGEDWRGVKLVLSTAAPMTWTELPELSSIRIGRAQPTPPARAGFRPAPQGAGMLFSDLIATGRRC